MPTVRLPAPPLLAAFALLLPHAAAAGEARPPNILLIVSDDQGYGDLGVLNDALLTPHLDRLAREGVRLTDFSVAWPACTPSRGALLTGRYPQRNGISDMIRNEAPDYGYEYKTGAEYAVTWERVGGMDTGEVMIPAALRPAGYVSGIFGKWDLGVHRRYLPLQRGFDDFYGFVNTGIDYFTHERYGVPSMYRGNEPTTKDRGTYATDLFEREAARFLKDNADRPFFLYVPFNAPHSASNLDPQIRGAAQAPESAKKFYPKLQREAGYRTVENYGRYNTPAEVPNAALRTLEYRASVTAMDAAIGTLLGLLDEHDLTGNTLVFFCSDNGGGAAADNAPLRGGKGDLFEGGVRVCALARWPGRLPAGTVSDEFLTSLDLFPTLLAAAGAAPPAGVVLDGFDLLPVLAGDRHSPRGRMFWHRRDEQAARLGDWKWIENGEGEFLFDLAADLGEHHNLAAERPDRTRRMRHAFADWQHAMDTAEPKRGPFRDF